MTIGERIRDRRKELHMTQEELAKKLNYKNKSAICRVEKDYEQNLTLDRVSAFAKALGVTEAYLMGWKEIDKFEKEAKKNGYIFEVTTIPDEEVETSRGLIVTDEQEYELLQLYRNADEETKRMIVEMLSFFKSKKQN